jgi:cell division protein FtsB
VARRARKRPSRSRLALRWLGIAVLLAIAFAYVHPLRAYLDARTTVAESEVEVANLATRNRALAKRLERAGTDAFVEQEARRLGLVRPGERLFIVKGVEGWKKRSIR